LQSLFSGRVAGAMMTPPSVYLAQDQGYKVFLRRHYTVGNVIAL
jgi:hypothetical protein